MEEKDDTEKKRMMLKQLVQVAFTLTKREMEIFALLAAGKTNKQIALALNISPHTVQNHRASIYKKFKVQSKFALYNIAKEMGVI